MLNCKTTKIRETFSLSDNADYQIAPASEDVVAIVRNVGVQAKHRMLIQRYTLWQTADNVHRNVTPNATWGEDCCIIHNYDTITSTGGLYLAVTDIAVSGAHHPEFQEADFISTAKLNALLIQLDNTSTSQGVRVAGIRLTYKETVYEYFNSYVKTEDHVWIPVGRVTCIKSGSGTSNQQYTLTRCVEPCVPIADQFELQVTRGYYLTLKCSYSSTTNIFKCELGSVSGMANRSTISRTDTLGNYISDKSYDAVPSLYLDMTSAVVVTATSSSHSDRTVNSAWISVNDELYSPNYSYIQTQLTEMNHQIQEMQQVIDDIDFDIQNGYYSAT